MTKRRLKRLKNSKIKEMTSLRVSIIYFVDLLIIDNKFDEALDAYSEAIFCNVPPHKKAIYYCNRA